MGGTIMSVKVCQRFLYSLPTLELKVKSVLVKEFLISTKVGLRKLEHLLQKEIFFWNPYFSKQMHSVYEITYFYPLNWNFWQFLSIQRLWRIFMLKNGKMYNRKTIATVIIHQD